MMLSELWLSAVRKITGVSASKARLARRALLYNDRLVERLTVRWR